jgi:hypothetical protein
MTTSQTLEPHVNTVVHALTRELRKLCETLERPSFEKLEAQLLRAANEAVRRTLERELQVRSDVLSECVVVDGVRYRRHQPGLVKYHSLCGGLEVKRFTFRRVDKRNGETIVPLDLTAGLIQRTTPSMAYAIAQGHADMPSRDLEQHLRAAHRIPPSRSTLDRLGRSIGSGFKQSLSIVEPLVRAEEQLPKGSHGLSLGLDRTSVPMAEGSGEDIQVHYRMAYVGTVAITDRDGHKLTARRYAAAAHEGPAELLNRMMADVRSALAQQPSLHVLLVQDGADEMWNLMRPALKAALPGKRWLEAIDWYHLSERLAQISELLEPDTQRREKLVERWKRSLERNDRAVYSLIMKMNKYFWSKAPHWRAMGQHLTYFTHSPKMHYASLRKLGLPVGSGITEGACKSLIAIRAKRSGQRWRPRGIDAVLAVRSTQQSDRLAPCWALFSQQYTTPVLAA